MGEERRELQGLSLGGLHLIQGVLLFSALFSEQPALSLGVSPSVHDRNDKSGGCCGGWDWESPLAGGRGGAAVPGHSGLLNGRMRPL